jgi:hypothetical protein
LKGGAKSEGLKCQFSQVERDLDLQEIPKLVPIPKKRTFISLGEGGGVNHQVIFISNNLKCFPFVLTMFCISNF